MNFFYRIPVEDFLQEGFKNFRSKFNVVKYHNSAGCPYMSRQQFIRFLHTGRRGVRGKYDDDLKPRIPLGFCDHSAFWKLRDGSVIYTTLPYQRDLDIYDECQMVARDCEFPSTFKFEFLDEKYRYRLNGHYFIVLYDEARIQEEVRKTWN